MKYPTIRYIFDRRKLCCDTPCDTRGFIEVEISFNRRRKWISTGVSVYPNQWDASRLIVNHPDQSQLNIRIEAVKKPVDDYVKTLMIREEPFTFEGLSACLERKSNSDSFVTYVENRIKEQTDIKELTKKAHRKLVSALRRFKKIETFNSLTRSNILEYDQWLHEQKYAQPTIHTYHKLLKRYINEALSRDLIHRDPYVGMRIEKGKSKKRKYLTQEEVDKIRKCKVLSESMDRVRDLFIFQCYTGLAYADLAKFDFSRVEKRGDRYVLTHRRQKTDEDYYIVFLPQALEVLKKYDFKLPKMSNQQYNLRLKVLADHAKVHKNVTCHMARHTFAGLCLNNGTRIETLAKMMGHTDIKTTQIYANIFNKTVEVAFDKLKKKLK